MGLQVGAINLLKKVLSNGKVVRTQTLNGKTFTNVYDEAGELLITRAKKIERYNVGDKKVITTTVFEDDLQAHGYYCKIVKDKVYTQDGVFLGSRKKTTGGQALEGRLGVQRADIEMKNGNYIKTVEAGDIYKQTRCKNGIREYSDTSYRGNIRFDEHGLPRWNLETNGIENLF